MHCGAAIGGTTPVPNCQTPAVSVSVSWKGSASEKEDLGGVAAVAAFRGCCLSWAI